MNFSKQHDLQGHYFPKCYKILIKETYSFLKLRRRDKRIHEEIGKEYLIKCKDRAVDDNTLQIKRQNLQKIETRGIQLPTSTAKANSFLKYVKQQN